MCPTQVLERRRRSPTQVRVRASAAEPHAGSAAEPHAAEGGPSMSGGSRSLTGGQRDRAGVDGTPCRTPRSPPARTPGHPTGHPHVTHVNPTGHPSTSCAQVSKPPPTGHPRPHTPGPPQVTHGSPPGDPGHPRSPPRGGAPCKNAALSAELRTPAEEPSAVGVVALGFLGARAALSFGARTRVQAQQQANAPICFMRAV